MRMPRLMMVFIAAVAALPSVGPAMASAKDKSIDEMTVEELYAEADILTTKLARMAEVAKGNPTSAQVEYAASLLARLSQIEQRLEKLRDRLPEKEYGYTLYLYEGVNPEDWEDPKRRGKPSRILSSGVYSPTLGTDRLVWEGEFFKGSYINNNNPVGKAKLTIRLDQEHKVISIDREDTSVNRAGAGWAYTPTFYYYELKLAQAVDQDGDQRVIPGAVWEKQGADQSKLKFIHPVQAVFYRAKPKS